MQSQFCDRCGAQQTYPDPDRQPTRQPADQSPAQHHRPQHQPQQQPTNNVPTTDSDDSLVSRRAMILSGGALSVLGLGGAFVILQQNSEPPFQQARDPWSNQKRSESSTSIGLTVDLDLPTGRWAIREFNPTMTLEFGYEFENSTPNPLEVFVFDRSEFERFREGESITHYTSLHDFGTSPSASGSMPSGEYIVALDNTAFGEQSPDGDVSGTFRIGAGL